LIHAVFVVMGCSPRSCKAEKKKPKWKPPFTRALLAGTCDVPLNISEPEERAEGYPHIMVCTSGEINFVAGLQTQTNRSKMPF